MVVCLVSLVGPQVPEGSCSALTCPHPTLHGWPQAVGTYGDAAIVMDAETGAVLYAQNIQLSRGF